MNPTTSFPAVDCHADYCSDKCRKRAFTQYYAFMASPDGEGMSEKYALLRSQYASAGTADAPLIQSFHVLAALRICAITEQCKKRGELDPNQCTFDMPAFRCLLRPGDLGEETLSMSGFRVPFNKQYRAYEKVRETLPSSLRKQVNGYDLGWYDNIWGLLMMNCVNGGGVQSTGEVTSVCLMRAGSFINHSTNNHNAVLLPQRDHNQNLGFVAVRDIAAGEEVTITYVDPSIPSAEKIRLLATQYFIHEGRSVTDKDAHKSKFEDKKKKLLQKIKSEKSKIITTESEEKEKAKINIPDIVEIEASAEGTIIDADHTLEAELRLEQLRLQEELESLGNEHDALKKEVVARGL